MIHGRPESNHTSKNCPHITTKNSPANKSLVMIRKKRTISERGKEGGKKSVPFINRNMYHSVTKIGRGKASLVQHPGLIQLVAIT